MANRLINLLKVIQWVSNGVTTKARLSNFHSQSLDTTAKKNFSSVLNTPFKSITEHLFWRTVELQISQSKWQICRRVAICSIHPSLACSASCTPCYAESSSSIKMDVLRLLWRTVNATSGISPKASQKAEKKSTCCLSPGGKKAATTGRLPGEAMSSRCKLALKNIFCFSFTLRLLPKCFQC